MTLLLLICSCFIINSTDSAHAEGNNDISTYATTSVNPTASLTIGGDAVNKQVITSPGSVGYRSHTVTVEASDIESYALVLSGPTNLTSGTSTMVSGAGGKTPTAMSDNTWGYSWGDANTTKESSTYQSLTTNGSTLTGDRVSNFGVNFTKNLFFAAKFSEDADPGRYRANVTLSLAATPRAIATGFGGIVDMQDMTGAICASVPIGTTGSLEDIRDQSVYTVAKLSDGNCWMTQNLELTREGLISNNQSVTLSSNTSNVANDNNFEMPISLTKETIKNTDFSADDGYYSSKVYNSEESLVGVHYSFAAASAGTGDASIVSGDVPSDICPKGWRLPTNSENRELLKTAGIYELSTPGEQASFLKKHPYNFYTSALVQNGKINSPNGWYFWGSTVMSNSAAMTISYNGSQDQAIYFGNTRYIGLSVRCIADDERTIDDISIMQEMTPKVCENTTTLATDKILTDTRDGSTYTVNKLSDGKCWMMQNLTLDLTQAGIATTDGSDNLTTAFPENALESLDVFANDNTAIQFSKSPTVSTEYPGNGQGYKDNYGYYYSWCAAAGGTCSTATTDGANASGSICPKGWKLPQGGTGTTNDFAIMGGITGNASLNTNHWSDAKNISFTNGVLTVNGSTWLATGSVNVDGLRSPGTLGLYWSGTASSSTNAYRLYFNSSSFYPADSNSRLYGFSVRCVAK